MNFKASKFILNRGYSKTALTSNRINAIIWYIAECYQLIKQDKPIYDFRKLKITSKIKQEDHLRFRLVTDYLRLNKVLMTGKCSDLSEIDFHCEAQFEYYDVVEKKESADKIDISISRLGLQEVWNDVNENIYFAIECKRIKILSDCEDYTLDTEKFANRNYLSTRLPFEGQLGFIENEKLTHQLVSKEINSRLPNRNLVTDQLLQNIEKHPRFDACYHSKHKRKDNAESRFEVIHLLLDYSSFIK